MSAPDSVLRVALPVPLPRLFDYRPPADGPGEVGCRVRVPFGNRILVGLVAEIGPPESGMAELREAEAVLDLFAGSGSTLIAAEQTGRRGFGMELDPLYCDVVVARFESFSGITAERVPVEVAA